jgi:AraC-like DNA-binding protein
MRWAAGRLAAGAESVKSVAFEVGFTDPRAFARQFRNRTAMAPHTLLATHGKRSSPGMVV